MIKCNICGKEMLSVNYLHLRVHGITLENYKTQFPNSNVHSEEVIKKISAKLIGNKYSVGRISPKKGLYLEEVFGAERAKQIKSKISLSKIGRKSHRRGIKATDEYGEQKALGIGNKIRTSKVGRTYEDLYGDEAVIKRQKKIEQGLHHNAFKGKHFTEESRNKLSQAQIANNLRGKNNPRYGTKLSTQQIEKMSVAMLNKWQDPVFRDKCVKATMMALKLRPTKPEKIIASELGLFWRYVGDGQLIIGSKCPDFWNGDHKLIEMFGDYWHRNHNPENWVNYYKKWGYDCLVIWEHELEDLKKAKLKVMEFEAS